METTAIVVARSGSVRVPNKALRMIDGEPLLGRKIRQLMLCESINRVVAGVDSDELAECAELYGAEVVRRPEYYCDETLASANEMISNMCELIKTDVVVWAHPTNPLISADSYSSAIKDFKAAELNGFDSLMSGVTIREHLWDDGLAFNFDPYSDRHIPASELPPLFMQDGGIFIQRHASMVENNYFYGKTPFQWETPENERMDINTPEDFRRACAIAEYSEVLINKPLDTKTTIL